MKNMINKIRSNFFLFEKSWLFSNLSIFSFPKKLYIKSFPNFLTEKNIIHDAINTPINTTIKPPIVPQHIPAIISTGSPGIKASNSCIITSKITLILIFLR